MTSILSMLCASLLISNFAFSQRKNKETVRYLYEEILNKRKPEELDNLVVEPNGFKKQVAALITAFPDAKWTITEIIAEGNKVMVKQKLQGTQTGAFQYIAPTNKTITTEGTAFYEFKDGKIIHYDIQTDRLGFLQQLGVVPIELTGNPVYFIDKFLIPAAAVKEFTERMDYNRAFIKTIDGFVEDKVFSQKMDDGHMSIITVATWKSKEHLAAAKAKVQAEYKRINFDPAEFSQRLHVQMERGIYSSF